MFVDADIMKVIFNHQKGTGPIMTQSGIIIGGGASGLMAAIAAAECGAKVTILEHMPRVGKKILSTGNGKCNMTNLRMEADCYRAGKENFPMAVIKKFPISETLAFFRRLGIVTTEKNGYVYPASGQAQTVLDALREKCESLGIEIFCDCEVQKINAPFKNGRFQIGTSQGTFSADFVILAAGSMAAKITGSDGSGYGLAKSLGHRIRKPLPALVQLRCGEPFFKAVSGVRTEARVALYADGQYLCEDTGELQLTDYGISGIPVFQVSRYAAEALDKKREVEAAVDFFPKASEEEFFQILQEQRKFLADRNSEGFLNGIFHKKLAALFLKEAGLFKGRAAGSFSDKELKRLAALIKNFSLTVTATNSFDQAQVCMGGVNLLDVNPDTMESRLVCGLYFAGEILDVDGICGGYNLQWAWSSGRLAGVSAASQKDRL